MALQASSVNVMKDFRETHAPPLLPSGEVSELAYYLLFTSFSTLRTRFGIPEVIGSVVGGVVGVFILLGVVIIAACIVSSACRSSAKNIPG